MNQEHPGWPEPEAAAIRGGRVESLPAESLRRLAALTRDHPDPFWRTRIDAELRRRGEEEAT